MKLLLDANISWRLCSFIEENFSECIHINKTSLSQPAKDHEIWLFAKKQGYTIITQDSDFLNLLEVKGYPPKVILIKTGNVSRIQMQAILLQARSSVIEFCNNDDYGLLEIF